MNAAALFALLLLEDEAVLLTDLRGHFRVDRGFAVLREDLELDEVLDDLEELQAHAVRQVLHQDRRLDVDDLGVSAFFDFLLNGLAAPPWQAVAPGASGSPQQ